MKKVIRIVSVILLLAVLVTISIFSLSKSESKASSKPKSTTEGNTKNNSASTSENKPEKILIVYYSLTGNTDQAAGIMKNITNADIIELQPDFDYFKVQSRKEMEDLGKQQVTEGFKPALKNPKIDVANYDLIIVGSPVWWNSVTPAVMSFLSQYDLSEKKVAPFCTCGTGAGDFFTQFEASAPDAQILEGLTLTESDLNNEEEVTETITQWLNNM